MRFEPRQGKLKTLRREVPVGGPRGLGDTVAAVTRATGIERAVKAWERVTGKHCWCPRLRAWLNEKVPYQ